MADVRITTADNPFNPFDDFDRWYKFDTIHGYNSLGLVARLAFISDQLSEVEKLDEEERAIDSIVSSDINVDGNWRKLTREDADTLFPKQESSNEEEKA